MPEPAPDRPTALVVEDDEAIATLVRFILERAGYRVAHAADGQAAEAFIRSLPVPAVTLLDVMLPHRDGFELLALLRRQPGWDRVPVLMLTGKAQQRDIARALEAGADDVLPKPFRPDELLERLRRLAAP